MAEAARDGLQIERVDWLDSGGRSGLLRVHGRWAAAVPLPELVIPTPAGEERHASLPDPRADRDPQTWRGAYVVRTDVVAAAGDRMQLELASGARLAVPAPSLARTVAPAPPAPLPPEEPAGGEVVDRAVLAERRARRAEAAEQAQARIAREALRAVEILELRAAELEERLEAAGGERPAAAVAPAADDREAQDLRARLQDLEAQLRDARAAAAQPQPAPAPDTEADDRRVERLRSALSSAIVTIGDLRLALNEARVRRRVADVEHGADGVRLAVLASERAGVDAQLAALRERLSQAAAREAQLREAAEAAASRAGEAERAHEETRRRLDERSDELRRARERMAGLEAEVAAARAEAERVAGEDLPEAVKGAVERREAELRAEHAEATAAAEAELAAARDELERLEAELAAAETAREVAEAAVVAAESERRAAEVAWAARAEELAAAAEKPATPAPVEPQAVAEVARRLAPPPPDPGTAEQLVADLDAAAAALRREAPPADALPPEPALERPLRTALAGLAREHPEAAAAVLEGLLPGQWPALPRPIEYDLTITGVGTRSVSVKEDGAAVVEARRPRRRAELRIRGDAVSLAELLAGLRPRPGRFGRLRARGRRGALEVIEALQSTRVSLEEVLRAGGTVDPALALRCLGHAVPPGWTRGHRFTVAHTFTDSGETLQIVAADGEGLTVTDGPPATDPDATVAMSRATFTALLRGEAPPERPTVRGDHRAVDLVREWADRVRHGQPPGAA